MIKLSILIPTKNRSEYLDDVLSSLLTWKRDDFEVIIQDNSDDLKTHNVVEKYRYDHRVKYFYVKEHLSVIDNFEYAVKNSSGKIITAIGDDDGILPIVMDVADWMLKNSVEAVLTNKA
ncbi:TPA: glycosyltransferase family 2 protein, partial [Escherichia coli]|nr:glycosyltransferase family 2 protein [Escherichia coli]